MDDELTAMHKTSEALAGLDDAARKRVIRWLADKYGTGGAPSSSTAQDTRVAQAPEGEDFADFFHRAGPSTDKERAIVAAYWLRQAGTPQFPSMEINAMLKDLGHRASNITDALTSAMREKPALVIQVKKSGAAKQARKLYKLTDAGVKWVESRTIDKEQF